MEYKFKRPTSKPEGRLYWDATHPSADETGTELLEQMDFPLSSIALAYDGINDLDLQKLGASRLEYTLSKRIHIP